MVLSCSVCGVTALSLVIRRLFYAKAWQGAMGFYRQLPGHSYGISKGAYFMRNCGYLAWIADKVRSYKRI